MIHPFRPVARAPFVAVVVVTDRIATEFNAEKFWFLARWQFQRRRRPVAALDRRPSPAREAAYRDSIDDAVELMRRIDARFPTGKP